MTTPRRFALLGLAPLAASAATAGDASAGQARFGLDVAADCNRFTNGGVGHLDANPVFGDFFMQEGVIYEPGTFDRYCPGGDGCGLKPDGAPQFPEQVIGKWTCYGQLRRPRRRDRGGRVVYTTQVYEFNVEKLDENVNAPGRTLFVSRGLERIDEDEPWYRAIAGGRGAAPRS